MMNEFLYGSSKDYFQYPKSIVSYFYPNLVQNYLNKLKHSTSCLCYKNKYDKVLSTNGLNWHYKGHNVCLDDVQLTCN